jgi:hypothetical protein
MPGAARARAATGIRLSASSTARNPAAATGIHGTWLSRVSYQPWPANAALAAIQPPSRTAVAPVSSAACLRPRPARMAPP